MQQRYEGQTRMLVAIDSIVFGFEGANIKLLVIKRGLEPERGKWSLPGGFVQPDEDPDHTAIRVLKELTGLDNVYLEQLQIYGKPSRDPVERTLSVAYFALIDMNKYQQTLSEAYHAEWFDLSELPELIFDHGEMVKRARKQLRYKAALHPVIFKLLPERFTIPQLQQLYESVYQTAFDDRNFSRKLLSTGLLIKMNEKDKLSSKKGAFYYQLNQQKFTANFEAMLNFVPNHDKIVADSDF
ncbi:NUDIX hydrolase [Mucilaginibacter sp.]